METLLSWRTLEHAARERRPDWFWAVGIIAISVAITAILFQNILLGILIILSAFTLMLQAARTPKEIEIHITNDGVAVETTFYAWTTLESYWIDTNRPEQPRLLLKSKKLLTPLIVIPMTDVDTDSVTEILHEHIPAIQVFEPLTQTLMEYLGF